MKNWTSAGIEDIGFALFNDIMCSMFACTKVLKKEKQCSAKGQQAATEPDRPKSYAYPGVSWM